MTINEFIFSGERKARWSRHFIFWLCWFLYLSCTQLRNQSPDEIGMNHFIIYQLGVSANRVLLQILFCYPFIYLIMPAFFQKRKFKKFAIITCAFIIAMYWVTYYDYLYIWSDRNSPIFFDIPNVKPLSLFQTEYFSIYSNLHCTGTFVSLSLILAVKYYKSWFKKERENEILIYQNSQAELQLLKAQVHPHFLFNTLNNIYSLMLDDSPKAITVLNELSGMVLYMTNEGNRSIVPIDNEIKMLLDYIGLEKIRYGDRLDMTINIHHKPDSNLFIAPLLMIPFVENSFKHGASKTLDKARIQLYISTENEWLDFKLINNIYPFQEADAGRVKIGLKNVRKRLQILYPEKHQLQFQSINEIFTVSMKIFLGKQLPVQKDNSILTNKNIPVYA
jgi:sensor histidine kinase YesM